MEFPIKDLYLFPELNFPKYGYNRKDLEDILNKIFTYNKFSGDKIVTFLKYYYDKECQKQALNLLSRIKVDENEKINFEVNKE